jgi:glycosyltransferase involved in cell wall biosynthesis
VPSEFAKTWYRERVGLQCHVLPNAIDWDRVRVEEDLIRHGRIEAGDSRKEPSSRPRSYVTFVNPQPAKGLVVFARIAEQLARCRPDIPLLVVEGRARAERSLARVGLDLSFTKNLYFMENTPDPRRFYAITKLLLMPSLVPESFGLTAAEALINGIPVLASNRGALPETLGQTERSTTDPITSTTSSTACRPLPAVSCPGGFLFDIPARNTPESTDIPTPDEVEPWVQTIIRLWDDESLYRQASRRALAHAQRWHPDRLRRLYTEFFAGVTRQPGPPIVPRPDFGQR